MEIGLRTLRVLDAAALPALLMWPLFKFLGGDSLVVWTLSGLVAWLLFRRLRRAVDWYAPYRMRFLTLVMFACVVSWSAALIHTALSPS